MLANINNEVVAGLSMMLQPRVIQKGLEAFGYTERESDKIHLCKHGINN